MKKSILALGAAAVIGGLGFAGSAQAVAVFGSVVANGDNHGVTGTAAGVVAAGKYAPATALALNPAGIGHILFVPYYTAQQGMGTLLTITNTDELNGKAVKVRFRGAANSDDVYDFTVMLSPGDVWTATITNQGGPAYLTVPSDETTCTLPANVNGPFNTLRLDQTLSTAALNMHTAEGYIEILNMADIPPKLWMGTGAAPLYTNVANPLFGTIKHKAKGSPVCDSSILQSTSGALSSTTEGAVKDAFDAGLGAPTGQLMASFAVINVADLANYGGAATAIRAESTAATAHAAGVNGYGNIVFSPQVNDVYGNLPRVPSLTGDPLLRRPIITTLWFDLPDMSTPYVPGATETAAFTPAAPLAQTLLLGESNAMGRTNVINEYVNAPLDGWATDWVVAQPTRRYYAAVDYKTSPISILYNTDMTGVVGTDTTYSPPPSAQNVYTILRTGKVTANDNTAMGTYACMSVYWGGYDREENGTSGGTSVSPGATVPACGEVYTLSFVNNGGTPGASKVLGAQISNLVPVGGTPGPAGWARVELGASGGITLPSVGYAATSMKTHIGTVTGNWGYLIPHRWN